MPADTGRIARIRERRQQHEEEMLSVHWFTAGASRRAMGPLRNDRARDLTRRAPVQGVRIGRVLKRRRYHPDDVAAYEAKRVGHSESAA
jgi:hypothetical protein